MGSKMGIHTQSLTLCCLLGFLLINGREVVQGSTFHNYGGTGRKPTKMFVFGDSFADTGNSNASSLSWKRPSGITFPGKPAGRFSDGRVLTDYIASFLRIETPIAYKLRRHTPNEMKYGVNFAFGGAGVFNTILTSVPNMSIQIDLFQQLLNEPTVCKSSDLKYSVALVSLAGSDYYQYLFGGANFEGLPAFIPKVVKQLTLNLKRIYRLGIKKVFVTAMETLGCLPLATADSLKPFQECNTAYNDAVKLHNKLLHQVVAKLNKECQSRHPDDDTPFIILNLYESFSKILQNQQPLPGGPNFENPLVPCCVGVSLNSSCGSVDDEGNKLYTVCSDPRDAFFWDMAHPTNEGWRAVYLTLIPMLMKLR